MHLRGHTYSLFGAAFGLLCALLADSALAQKAQEPAPWRAPLGALTWQALPSAVNHAETPRALRILGGTAEDEAQVHRPPYSARTSGETAAFEVTGRVPDLETMVWSAGMPPRDMTPYGYYVLRYRAKGIARSEHPLPVVALSGKTAGGQAVTESLMDAAQALNDNEWHVIVGKRKLGFRADALRVQVGTDDTAGSVELAALSFHASLPEVQPASEDHPLAAASEARFEPLDLRKQMNDNCAATFARVLEKTGAVMDGATSLKAGRQSWHGVSFAIAEGNNMIRPPEDVSVNSAPVTVVGVKTTRNFFEPIGRDDTTEIAVGRKASEVFFILIADLAQSGPRSNLPPGPQYLNDIEGLAVELKYSDGDSDFAFPYSLADRGFGLLRMAGAYCVPADAGRTLEKMVLHNRVFGQAFSLAAVTVNTGAAVLPALTKDQPPVRTPEPLAPAQTPPYVRQEGAILRLGNAAFEMAVNTANGFSIEKIKNNFSTAETILDPASGLEVRVGDRALTGRAFKTELVEVKGAVAVMELTSSVPAVPMRLTITLTVDASPQVQMNLTAVNAGVAALSPAVRFPALRNVTVGALDDNWMFFPQYCTAISNLPGLYFAENDRCFPLQVFDIYNPRLGGGIAVLTHNLSSSMLNYCEGKTEHGVDAFVETVPDFVSLPPGGTKQFTEACLVFHGGDWHEALRAYEGWRSTWYKPLHAQDKEWFKRAFYLRSEMTKQVRNWVGIFPIYDGQANEFKMDEFIKTDTEYLGMAPDILHMVGWIGYNTIPEEDFWDGDFALKYYTGGADTLRAAIRKVQGEHHIPMSLYTISDRCDKATDIAKQLFPRLGSTVHGRMVENRKYIFPCVASTEWQDYIAAGLKRAAVETGAKAIYMDVYGYTDPGARCYSAKHGHPVPSVPNRSTLSMSTKVREALPADVAVWCESQLDDVSSQFNDGNIHYYCTSWGADYFARTRDRLASAPQSALLPHNAYRFALPEIKQFIYFEADDNWVSDFKFQFFDGEGLYDAYWRQYATAQLDQVRKSLKIQKKYADCFATATPLMEAATEKDGVHANKFPGEGRTAWTLFNARYMTVRGPVLAVDHVEGATYADAWNNQPLTPEIAGGKAVLTLKLDPQGLGCVVQTLPEKR